MHRPLFAATALALSLAVAPHAHARQRTGANLTLKMTQSARTAAVGQTVTLVLVAQNKGPQAAESVFIVATLPGNLAVVDENCGPSGPSADGTQCEYSPPLPADESLTMTIDAQVTASSPSPARSSGCVYSASGTPDPRSANNCRSRSLTITKG